MVMQQFITMVGAKWYLTKAAVIPGMAAISARILDMDGLFVRFHAPGDRFRKKEHQNNEASRSETRRARCDHWGATRNKAAVIRSGNGSGSFARCPLCEMKLLLLN